MFARTCLLGLVLSCGAAAAPAQPAHHALVTTSTSSWTPPTSKDTHDDPSQVRPGYGNADLHTWFPLTTSQTSALASLSKAQQGDAQAITTIAQVFGVTANTLSDVAVAVQPKQPEIAAMLSPQNAASQRARILAYEREGHDLYGLGAWRTMVRMIDLVAPSVSETARVASGDADAMSAVAWVSAYYALALAIVGRGEEAVATAFETLDHLDPRWPQADGVRKNAYVVIGDQMLGLLSAKEYDKAARVPAAHLEACRAEKYCASDLSVVYRNWASDNANDGDWPAARDVLQRCVAALPDDAECKAALGDLESRHQF